MSTKQMKDEIKAALERISEGACVYVKNNDIVFTDKEMVNILTDVARIEDKELRLSLINKLTNN